MLAPSTGVFINFLCLELIPSTSYDWLTPTYLSDTSSNFISLRKLSQNITVWMRFLPILSVILLMYVHILISHYTHLRLYGQLLSAASLL